MLYTTNIFTNSIFSVGGNKGDVVISFQGLSYKPKEIKSVNFFDEPFYHGKTLHHFYFVEIRFEDGSEQAFAGDWGRNIYKHMRWMKLA